MEKIILTFLALIMTTFLSGQKFKVSVAPAISVALINPFAIGGPSQSAQPGFNTSFDYLFRNDKKLSFGLGFSYQFNQVRWTGHHDNNNFVPRTEKFNLFSISFRSTLNFKRNFYLSLDPSVDLNSFYTSKLIINNQSGCGLSFAFGKSIKIKKTLLLNIEPRLWVHNIIPFQDENSHYLLTTNSLNIGLIFGPETSPSHDK
jgi:hypothetical protein